MGNQLILPCEVGQVSDGDHTFEELYDHRNTLFLALLCQLKFAWYSRLHSDGTSFDGWFIAGIDLIEGQQITYHLPDKYLPLAEQHLLYLQKAPAWDGHTSSDVLDRLDRWLHNGAGKQQTE